MRWTYKCKFFIITEIKIAVRLKTTVYTYSCPRWETSFMYTRSTFVNGDCIFLNDYISGFSSVSQVLRYTNSKCKSIFITVNAKYMAISETSHSFVQHSLLFNVECSAVTFHSVTQRSSLVPATAMEYRYHQHYNIIQSELLKNPLIQRRWQYVSNKCFDDDTC